MSEGTNNYPEKMPLKLVVAGGGTGGHLFPGIALAKELMRRNPANSVLFVSRKTEFEKKAVSKAGFSIKKVPAAGVKGKSPWSKAKALAILLPGVGRAWIVLRNFSPDLVAGLGGYASVPVCLAACLMKIPIVLCEQNSIAGIANRILVRFSQVVYTAFDGTSLGKHSSKEKVLGNPIRRELISKKGSFSPDWDKKKFTLLILGGSQGAHSINNAVTRALNLLEPSVAKDLYVIHQTGARDESSIIEAYARLKIANEVKAFFFNMARIYDLADLVVCRAGAGTIAELTALGKPALFIPFPYAADGHQEKNARLVTDRGGGEIILEKELTPDLLARRITAHLRNRGGLEQMASASQKLGRPFAAKDIVDDWVNLVARDKRTV